MHTLPTLQWVMSFEMNASFRGKLKRLSNQQISTIVVRPFVGIWFCFTLSVSTSCFFYFPFFNYHYSKMYIFSKLLLTTRQHHHSNQLSLECLILWIILSLPMPFGKTYQTKWRVYCSNSWDSCSPNDSRIIPMDDFSNMERNTIRKREELNVWGHCWTLIKDGKKRVQLKFSWVVLSTQSYSLFSLMEKDVRKWNNWMCFFFSQ